MLTLLTNIVSANTNCPLQKNIQSDFSIELPSSEEGSQIKGTCSHKDSSILQPVYADCKNGNWENIDTRYCQFFEEQAISCENMGIHKTILWKSRFLYTTESGSDITFEPDQTPSKEQQRIIRKFARKNHVSLEDGLQKWSSKQEMSILLQERLACILSTRPSRNTLPKYLQDEDCLFQNPSKERCRGYSDSTYAQSFRYHPSYLIDWNVLERNSGTEFHRNTSSHWEVRPDRYGKWKYAQLYQYDPSIRWSSQNEVSKESTEILQRRFEGNTQMTSLIITSEQYCKEISKQRKKEISKGLKIVCLPDSMQVYTLGSGWYDSNHNRSIFAITGFDNVEIRNLNIEVRPHPDLNLLLDGNLCPSKNDQDQNKNYQVECETVYRNLFTEYLFPDNYREVIYHTLRSQSPKATSCKDATNHDIKVSYSSDIPDWWNTFSSQCTTPYTTIYQQFSTNFDLHKYMRMTGNIFFIVDNKNVSIANVNTKGFTAESHFSLQSNDFVEIDGVSSQGISAQELLDQGVPLLDVKKGFLHTKHDDFNPQTTYYMGNGIDIFNGRNIKEVTTGYGANCCIDPSNKNQCSETKDYNGVANSIYSYTNIGPSPLETILQTDFQYRSRCSRSSSSCSKDNDCVADQETCIQNRCVQKCSKNTDCGTGSYCVKEICRDNSCDTNFITISNSSVFNCTQPDLRTIDKKGRKENIDGITVASTSGLIFNNHLYNFQCDSLSDLAQRRPCARSEEELHQWLRVERNDYENGVVKTEGTSEPENGIVYANNHFKNVRLVDYHRKWRAYYLQNNWFYNENYRLKSALNQANQEPITEWHRPYYGSLVFIGNQVYSQSKTHLWNEYPSNTVSPLTKIHSQHNLYVGTFNSFYTKKEGSFSLLKPLTSLPIEHYRFINSQRYPWTLENDIVNSPAIFVKIDTISPCPNPSTSSSSDSTGRYLDSYGCFFGESTSVLHSSMPMNLPKMNKISYDKNIYVHQYYNGTYRSVETNVGTITSD